MNKGLLGFRRLFNIGPMVSNTGGRPEGSLIRARIRDKRFLIAERSLNISSSKRTGKDRVAVYIPKAIVEPLGYETHFRVEPETNDYSEFILVPDEDSKESYYTGAGNRSSIVINSANTDKLPFSYPTKIGLDIDLRRPQDGILVRKLESYEKQKLGYVTQDEYLKIIEGEI